jgi:flagella basal body P-ring formation protein FlgA
MTRSLVALLILALCAPGAIRAQQARNAGSTSSPAPASATADPAAERLASLAAQRLGVERDRVVLEGPDPVGTPSAVRLLGSGAGGAFVAERTVAGRVVRHRIRVGVRASVPVAARDLTRGQALAAADLAWRDTVLWGQRPGTAPEAGWVVKRRLAAGTVLAPPAVAPAAVVEAGRAVTLVWRGGGLEVTTRAVAAGTAALGERVAVRTESGRRLWGIAEGADRVRIEGSR